MLTDDSNFDKYAEIPESRTGQSINAKEAMSKGFKKETTAVQPENLNDLSLEVLISRDLIERQLNELHPKTRLEFAIIKLKNENGKSTVSERQDAIIMLGELYHRLEKGQYDSEFTVDEKIKIHSIILDIFKWAIHNESNCVPHHELSYQIAARDMRELIPEMVRVSLENKSTVSRHEYIENLANIAAWDELEEILPIFLNDPNPDIRETAQYCHDRMRRYKNEPPLGALDIV